MKAVILAAGAGKRLGNENVPKPLTKLCNGKSILELQLEYLSKYVSIHDTLIIVGHQKEKIMDAFPDALFVYNPNFNDENTAKSLLRALHKIKGDVLWLNGDVIFHPSVLDIFLTHSLSCMVVNTEPVGKEEVKYRTDDHQCIMEISKEIEYPEGEALGINLFRERDLPLLKSNLARCSEKDYFEKAIQWSVDEGLKVSAVPIAANLCMEIDFPKDLHKANQLISSWAT